MATLAHDGRSVAVAAVGSLLRSAFFAEHGIGVPDEELGPQLHPGAAVLGESAVVLEILKVNFKFTLIKAIAILISYNVEIILTIFNFSLASYQMSLL